MRGPRTSPSRSRTRQFQVVLTGNPNCGKTTVFNALTGLRAKVGNYAGVTVERKEGRLWTSPGAPAITILDLPGTYSLSPQSLDEQISRDVLLNRLPDVQAPDLIVLVVDASNLERNLYFATQVIELGCPVIVALNMTDVASANGRSIDPAALSRHLNAPVVPMVASARQGIDALRKAILDMAGSDNVPASPALFLKLPESLQSEVGLLADRLIADNATARLNREAQALLLLTGEMDESTRRAHPDLVSDIDEARRRLETAGLDWRGAVIEARYDRIGEIQRAVTLDAPWSEDAFTDRLDRVLTHKVWGGVIFVALMALIFQSIFTFASIPMDAIQSAVDGLGGWVANALPPGDLNSLLVDGVIAGVGAVIIFLPQILLLFLFIGFMEDTGYMARAAFLMDRLMSKVGLHGKSFIPLLSSYACAIPGIMATRTIESPKDRLVTILVAPLMSCSARLPVYTLLIAACIPNRRVLGILGLPGLTLLGMYFLGTVVALGMAWIFKKSLLRGATPLLIMELPPYRRPTLRLVLRHMWERSKLFLKRAGTVILGINILLWFLATYPKLDGLGQEFEKQRQEILQARSLSPTSGDPEINNRLAAIEHAESGARLRHSFAGQLGQLIEPVIAPLGFDWKMGIGIVASFAAREVFVSTMSVVYNVGEAGDSESATASLAETLRQQRHPDGRPVYTPLVAITLMVFYVFALQCVSTVAVVRRETNSWKWPLFQWLYMAVLAWTFAFITFQGGRMLGWS